MRRRRFVQLASGAALGAALGCKGSEPEEPVAPGVPTGGWGRPDEAEAQGMLPLSATAVNGLEVMLLGGINPWDTFYVVPEHGDPARGGPYAGHQWWTYLGLSPTVPEYFAKCGGGDRPLLEPFAFDGAGVQVNLGPFVYPLRDRPDLLARMRILVLRHDSEPHEAAIPLALTGYPSGTRQMSSLGSHVGRYYQTHGDPLRTRPYSYVVYQSAAGIDENLDSATSVGLHSAAVRPMTVRLGSGAELAELLERAAVGERRSGHDALIEHYLARYHDRFRLAPGGAPARAPVLSDFAAAQRGVTTAPELASILSPEALSSVQAGSCDGGLALDTTDTSLALAARLLNAEQQPARHVTVMDGGLYTYAGGIGYDTHDNHVVRSSQNVVHFFRRLAERINRPGEGDPNKIDLDRTVVSLNTEFGRSPTAEFSKAFPNGSGLDHWPWGYVVVVLGGFVDEQRKGIVGALGEDSRAIGGATPAEHRAAMLMAQGIWPFEAESYRVADVQEATTELEAALILKERLLGYGS